MRRLSLVLVAFLLAGCWGGFVHEEQLIGGFALVAVDLWEDMSVGEGDETSGYTVVIPEGVFAAGFDRSHIIVKRHPLERFEGSIRPNRAITEFYIIPVNRPDSIRAKDSVMGPFDQTTFELKRQEVGVSPNLRFTRVFKHLE